MVDSSDGSDRIISQINVTPFVDVVLVLLVIFMLTAPTLLKDVIGIQLPKATSHDSKAPESIGVAVNRQGQILINGKLLSEVEMRKELERAVKTNANIQSIIAADTETRHGDVVRAIDLVKSSGIHRFAIQIQREF